LIFLRATDEDKFSGQATSVGIQTVFVINKINGVAFAAGTGDALSSGT